MMAPRFPCVVGGVAGDGCYFHATRGRPDEVVESGVVGNGQDELTPRYIFFTAVGNSSFHPHFAVVSTALSSIAAPLSNSSPPSMSKVTMKRGKSAAGAIAAAEASVMKKPDGDWVKSSMKKIGRASCRERVFRAV